MTSPKAQPIAASLQRQSHAPPFLQHSELPGAAATPLPGGMSHLVLQMEAEQSHLSEMIYDLTLEIIFLLTGEKHAAVKMASIEGLLRGMYPPLPVGGSLSQSPITKPSSQAWAFESNNQKILEVTKKIMELLSGDMRESSVEKDPFFGRVMEDQPPLTPPEGSRKQNPPEFFPHSRYSLDSTRETQTPRLYQVSDELALKMVKEEVEEYDERRDEWFIQEEASLELHTGPAQEDYNTPRHYQDEHLLDVKREETVDLRDRERSIEKESSPNISADWGLARDYQDHPDLAANGGIQSDNEMLDSSAIATSHLLSVQIQEQLFYCSVCGKGFSEEFSLMKHERVHRSKMPHPSFDWRSSEEVTLGRPEQVQAGEKSYFCNICGKTFAKKFSFITHKRVHMGEKPHSCAQCGKCFSQKSHLIAHERIHTGEKPFSCFECGRCFSQKAHLLGHRRVHTREKPYSCSECGRCFSQKAHLLGHQRVHTGEKPYSCSDCGKCFTHKSNLVRHKHAHTGKNLY